MFPTKPLHMKTPGFLHPNQETLDLNYPSLDYKSKVYMWPRHLQKKGTIWLSDHSDLWFKRTQVRQFSSLWWSALIITVFLLLLLYTTQPNGQLKLDECPIGWLSIHGEGGGFVLVGPWGWAFLYFVFICIHMYVYSLTICFWLMTLLSMPSRQRYYCHHLRMHVDHTKWLWKR